MVGDIADYFQYRQLGKRLEDLETPVPLIDLAIVERNVQRWQARCNTLGIANRPHIKTHKLAGLARYQIACGAQGITVQKLGEAEAMAKAGIGDMLLTFNILGHSKLNRIASLAATASISVVSDNAEILPGLSSAGAAAGRKISVLVECDTGMGRNGVQSPKAALDLAQKIESQYSLKFGGLMTYPAAGQRLGSAAFLKEASQLCEQAGLECNVISTGGTPDMWADEGLAGATEYRCGTYAYFDRSLVARGTCSFDDCAISVLATIVSTPTPQRAIVDAGTKSLTSDLLGLKGFGVIHDLGDAQIYAANEEHGFLDTSSLPQKPRIGDMVRIIPNHACPVSNLFDEVVLVRGPEVLGAVKVDARGTVQ